jgi:hypothetical protein
MSVWPTSAKAALARSRICRQLTNPNAPGSTPSRTFSMTDKSGAIDNSW